MIDLSVELAGVRLPNPLILASGIWGSGSGTLVRAAQAGAGAVTSKSCSLEARLGHPNPTVLHWGHGLINAVGLSNPGATVVGAELARAHAALADSGAALIASVFGDTPRAFAEAARIVAQSSPELLELNISCPNVESEFGRPFALEPAAAARVTEAVRAVYAGPLLVKLSPNSTELVAVARSVLAAGADGLTMGNTLGPGMLIDLQARRPILSNRVGGISGPALRPIAVRCVYELAAALNAPIIGMGGVASGRDALEMIMAGATAVGIGSGLYTEGHAIFGRILAEMEAWMQHERVSSLGEIRGCAHV